jgi:Skp family chaperone for outer membrane proteins
MIELVATVVITVSSVLLFGYWFRYTCLLILSAKTTRDFAGEVATANQLGFLQVQSQLRESSADLDRLRDALDRDYAVLMRLLKQAGDSSSEGSSIEKRMLEINYRLVGAWYRLSRQFSAAAARRALEEMSLVVEHFANVMGEQASSPSAA